MEMENYLLARCQSRRRKFYKRAGCGEERIVPAAGGIKPECSCGRLTHNAEVRALRRHRGKMKAQTAHGAGPVTLNVSRCTVRVNYGMERDKRGLHTKKA